MKSTVLDITEVRRFNSYFPTNSAILLTINFKMMPTLWRAKKRHSTLPTNISNQQDWNLKFWTYLRPMEDCNA